MTINEYIRRQRTIVARVVAIVLQILAPFRSQQVTELTWNSLMLSLYGTIEEARRQSSILAREFYDSQREIFYPDDPRYDVNVAPYDPRWFLEAMRPSQLDFQRQDTSVGHLVQAGFRIAKEIENGGRRTQLYAVQDDPRRPKWARVATGAETCAFCLMLVSRGPIYSDPTAAGVDATETEALELLDEEGQSALDELMTRWHPDCDCKIVPVFDDRNWPGRDHYLEMREVWKNETKGFSGRDKLNAFRRAIENGEIHPQDFAEAA